MLKLTYRGTTTIPVEAECITPENLRGKAPAEIAHLPVQHGNAPAPLGEFFHVEGDGGDGHIEIEGDCSRVKWVGAEMRSGKIVLRGNIGMHVGAEMMGGEIHVHGNAADWAGAEMRGGFLHIHGDAGHLIGAGYRGSRFGMRGGTILIDGKAGNEIGGTMRRGLIAVGGEVGDFPGVNLIAGTIFLFGASGQRAGANMKRGSMVFCGPSPMLLPTFRYSCLYRPLFVDIYLGHMRRWGYGPAQRMQGGRFHRYLGDLVSLARGEILVRES